MHKYLIALSILIQPVIVDDINSKYYYGEFVIIFNELETLI